MIGLPDDIKVALFDLDGVLTSTAAVHRKAWKQAFDDYLSHLDAGAYSAHSRRPFTDDDYLTYVDGRPRADGVRAFLQSRGLDFDDDTVDQIGTEKNQLFLDAVDRGEVEPYPGSVRYLDACRDAGIGIAVVTSSRNGVAVLVAADLIDYASKRIDGNEIAARHLKGKPAPDSYLEGAKEMDVDPAHAAVFEDAISGLQAGRAGHFGYVVGVNREETEEHAQTMRDAGADVVVNDLADLLEG
ncbi:beta-phosphoglucomutase family hydrolase [Gordonia jinhuaensis]|uniref:Hydrolase n=1 Tax=Gordonia jinhuaensis TaxID=1517702 RepID=A0A916WVU6_9ACTN|nr:HAD-IA family hydrolase [Gordonia jinhuaensis]GGB34057.1 hydrolase [Gordonia jinhuaensis]